MAEQFPALDDFNDFSSAPSGGGGQSDFLARERELLGDEFGPTPTGVPSVSDFEDKPSSGSAFPELDDAPRTSTEQQSSRMSNDFLSSFQREAPATSTEQQQQSSNVQSATVADDEDDDLSKFQSQYPDIAPYQAVSHATPQPPSQFGQQPQHQNGYSMEPSYSGYNPPAGVDEEESDAIRAWRDKQREEIEQRDQRSSERKEEAIRKAEKAIDDFYANYNQKKARQIAKNKEDEKAFTQARDDALGKGTTWERIAEILELQDSRSKTVAKGSKDLSRMKEVLLSLKREGDRAPNATGY